MKVKHESREYSSNNKSSRTPLEDKPNDLKSKEKFIIILVTSILVALVVPFSVAYKRSGIPFYILIRRRLNAK